MAQNYTGTGDRVPEVEGNRLESLRIRGFRSLQDVAFEDLPAATVLIGPNGSGKSNVIRFFEMLSWMQGPLKLEEYVARHGGADDQLFGGRRVTPRLEAEITIRTARGRNDYRFELPHAHPDRFIIAHEAFRFSRMDRETEAEWIPLKSAGTESRLPDAAAAAGGSSATTARVVRRLLRNCWVYQFHDTSEGSRFKQNWDVSDNNYLRSDGGNLSAILYRLEQTQPDRYSIICRNIARVLPGFKGFQLEESYGRVMLRWNTTGFDKTIGAHLTSDGSLRFFALVTLLSLPTEMLPDVILIDEPELGLHPFAVSLIGSMIKSRTIDRQIIVATQSPELVNAFDLQDIYVLELANGRTIVKRVVESEQESWVRDGYAPGQLWLMNALGGRP